MSTINNNSPFQMNSIQTAKQYIADLHKDHDAWNNAQKTANDVLTDLLVKCLRLYELMLGDSAESDQLRNDFSAYVKSTKLRFNGATHTIAKIAGIVFNLDDDKYNRRHASHYGRALQNALSAGIASTQLKAYIAQRGGVTKLAAGDSRPSLSTEDRAETAWGTLKTSSLANVSGASFAKVIDGANVGQRVLLLATQRANATFEIHAVVQNSSLVDAAYASKFDELQKAASNTNAASPDIDAARANLVAAVKA